MRSLRSWLVQGLAPADVDGSRYHRIVRVLATGRLILAGVVLTGVVALGDRFTGGSARFLGALFGVYLPFVLVQYWMSRRPRLGPLARAVLVAADLGVVTFFLSLFPDLRILAPYAYLFVVAFTTAMSGMAAGLAASALSAAGSLAGWPVELAAPLHRISFWTLVVVMALLIDGIGRQRNEAARLAAENHARMDEAQAIGHVGSWYWEEATSEVTCSDELRRIFGFEGGDVRLTHHDFVERVHPDDRARVAGMFEAALIERSPFEGSYRIVLPDGATKFIAAHGRVVSGRRGAGVVGTAQDVTEQRLAEVATEEALRRERDAAAELRALHEMRSAFLTAVSHELRTPLTGILGFAHTLEWADLDPGRRTELVGRLRSNAEKLDRLLGDLLDIDRLERGIVEPQRRPTDVAELIRRIADETDVAAKRPVELDLEPVVASVDPAKVERIVENLRANALKYTPAGTPIWLRARRHPEGVLICVEDDGPGVAASLRKPIFEPFRQGGRPSASPGVGIGLSLVARFAELHGGHAWVEERDGGGASFRVVLLDAPAPDDRATSGRPQAGGGPGVRAPSSPTSAAAFGGRGP